MAATFELYLTHGRKSIDQDMEDWGFEGPRLQGVVGTHTAYGNTTIWFATPKDVAAAKALTGWENWDVEALVLPYVEDCVKVRDVDGSDAYFGDWGIIAVKGA